VSNDSTYNGWSNHSTWLVNVWFSPTSSDLEGIKESLEQKVNDLANSGDIMNQFLSDQINLEEIDWKELAEHLEVGEDKDNG